MARRKRKEDAPVWEPPEFDEVGYMRKEIENAKISVVVIAWAVVGAIVFYIFFATNLAVVGFLLGLLVFGALYFVLPMLGLPIHGFKRRDWASHATVYFFSWLAFSILLLNAPFGDHTYPVVGSFEVGTFNVNATVSTPLPNSMRCYPAAPGSNVNVPAGGNNTVYVIFRATDNIAVRNVSVTLDTKPVVPTLVADRPNACTGNAGLLFWPGTYAIAIPIQGVSASYQVGVTALDTSGLETSASITIFVT